MNRLAYSLLCACLLISACTTKNPVALDQGAPPADTGARDGQVKFDGYIPPDGVKPDMPVAKPDMPVAKPDMPVAKPDFPVAKPDMPVVKPDMPVAKPDMPVAKPDMPVATPDMPVAKPDMPVVTPDMPVATPDMPVVTNNALCAGAQKVAWVGGKISVKGSTKGAANEYGTGINCGNYSTVFPANQRYYKVSLTAGKSYRFSFKPKYYYARMYLFQGCGISAINAGCGSGGKTGDVSASVNSGYTGTILFAPSTSGDWIVAVDGTNPKYSGDFTVEVDEYNKPLNVTCATAQKLTFVDSQASASGNTVGAKNEFGSSIDCGNTSYKYVGQQVYYKVSLTAGTTYNVRLKPAFYASMYIFRSSKCTAAGINGDCASNGKFGDYEYYVTTYGKTIAFSPAASGDYTIAVDSRYASYAGSFDLTVTRMTPTTNSTCAKATKLNPTGPKVVIHGSTKGLKNEYGTGVKCGQSSAYAFDGPQQYFQINLAAGSAYEVTLEPAFYYARFYLFGAKCGANAIDQDCASLGAAGDWASATSSTPGKLLYIPKSSGPHHIAVDSTGPSYSGMYKLTIEQVPVPTNGACAKAQAVALTSGQTTTLLGNTAMFANEFGSQIFCNNYSTVYVGKQAYYKFSLVAGQSYTFSLKPKFKNARFYIFDGSCKPADINLDCGSGGKTGAVSANSYYYNTVSVTFKPTKTGTYHLAVDSTTQTAAGPFVLTVK